MKKWNQTIIYSVLALSFLFSTSNPANAGYPNRSYDFTGGFLGAAYDFGYETAVAWRFVRDEKGTDYISNLGPDKYLMGAKSLPCAANQIKEWENNPLICQVAVPARTTNCRTTSGCGTFKVSQSILKNPIYLKRIYRVIQNPCEALVDPNTFSSERLGNVQGGLAFTPRAVWSIFDCATDHQVHGYNVKYDTISGIVKFQFDR
jgi:hypothetical protein